MDTVPIRRVDVSAFRIPTLSPESDGTLEWDSTTLVVVHAMAAQKTGLGYTYADASTAKLIESLLAPRLLNVNALDVGRAFELIVQTIRNLGRQGIASMAISALDICLWDLKAKLLDCSLLDLLGSVRDHAPVYASGGFTSYSEEELAQQMHTWYAQGFRHAKMKVGRDPARDIDRVRWARNALGNSAEIYVDANGAYQAKQALQLSKAFADLGVTWFEEPVSSDDLQGLRFIRERVPTGIRVAAGEYGYDVRYFLRMLESQAIDVLQADATRCGGVTGFLDAARLSQTYSIPFSFHCAPSLHCSLACAAPAFDIGEYFFDHQRIEQRFFDGAPSPHMGTLTPDRSRPGLGMDFKRSDAEQFRI